MLDLMLDFVLDFVLDLVWDLVLVPVSVRMSGLQLDSWLVLLFLLLNFRNNRLTFQNKTFKLKK